MRTCANFLLLTMLGVSLNAAGRGALLPRAYSPHGSVTIDTAPLASATGPFTLDMQFIEGDGGASGNNSITLSNLSFGGGSIVTPAASTTGGVTVSTSPLSVTLVDSSFFQDVQFSFTPGSSLSFQFTVTGNADPVAPDTFTLAILDSSGNEIPTDNPNGFNSLVEIDQPTTGAWTQIIGSNASSGDGVTATTSLVTACDVEGNSKAGITDVRAIVNEALGGSSPANDVNNDGIVNVVDIELVINAALGQGCPAT